MGGNKSKPLVQESARVVLSRRGAEIPNVIASNLPKVEPILPPTPVFQAIQPPSVPTTPTTEPSSNIPTSPPQQMNPKRDPVALHPDILKEISKWQTVRNSEPASGVTPKKVPKSAAQLRVERDTRIENLMKDNLVVRDILDETQLQNLCKEYRENGIAVSQLAEKYNIDEKKVQAIVSCIRSPILTPDPDEPDLFIAS